MGIEAHIPLITHQQFQGQNMFSWEGIGEKVTITSYFNHNSACHKTQHAQSIFQHPLKKY